MKFAPLLLIALLIACSQPDKKYTGWRIKGGTADGIQYSQLDQINKENVNQLQVAWSYQSGDADITNNRTQIQCNPIVVDGILYGTSPALKAFALDASNGSLLWKFEPGEVNSGLGVNRGVTYWEEGQDKRILYSFGEYLYAINALTGKKIESFGTFCGCTAGGSICNCLSFTGEIYDISCSYSCHCRSDERFQAG